MSKLGFSLSLMVSIGALALPSWVEAAPKLETSTQANRAALIAQAETTKIERIQLQPSDTGIGIILETATGKLTASTTSTQAKTATIELPNAVLALPDRTEFRSTNPATGIANISVTQVSPTVVRVTIAGTDGVPTLQAVSTDKGLTVTSTPAATTAQAEEEIEINVVGLRNRRGYKLPDTSNTNRTDTSIIDTPQAIQIVPKQVLEDQQVVKLEEGLRNVSGITFGGSGEGAGIEVGLRGFRGVPILLDGLRQYGVVGLQNTLEPANLESIEVLKGPASIAYGEIEPGGLINLVSKVPLSTPTYTAEVQAGSRGFFRPRIDFSGPLDNGKSGYRINALTSTDRSFRNFNTPTQRTFIAPTLTTKLSDRTDLTLRSQYLYSRQPFDTGRVALGNRVIDTPRNVIFNDPNDFVQNRIVDLGYNLEHRFNDNLVLRNSFTYLGRNVLEEFAFPFGLDPATSIITRNFGGFDIDVKSYAVQTNVVSKFTTGSLQHTLISGVDLNRTIDDTIAGFDFATPQLLDPSNPVYGTVARPNFRNTDIFVNNLVEQNRLGIYVQDQVALLDNVKLAVGLRYDTLDQKTTSRPSTFDPVGGITTQNESALTPRIGIVYQPTKEISLYGSYSQSFTPSTVRAFNGNPLKPERGEGYEVGVKADLDRGRLFATLAYFDIAKQNVATSDPNNPLFSIATGEQRSRGLELDVTGQIAPGWNLIASYAYTDARVSRDNLIPVGNRLLGVPENSLSLWTTYQIQQGNLQGLGAGFGFNYVGDRQGDLNNTFNLGSYFLTNAALFYRRDNWKAAINFKNIFNVDYSNSPFTNTRIDVGEPFTVVGSLAVEF
jgi:iron complex outermembrane recepter protein